MMKKESVLTKLHPVVTLIYLAGALGIMGADETKALVLGGIFPAGSVQDNPAYQQQLSDLAKWLGA